MNESDSFEQEKTDGISEQVDAMKGFLHEQGLAGGGLPGSGGPAEGDAEPGGSAHPSEGDVSFDRAASAVEGRWTSHGGDAPEHEPVVVDGAQASGDSGGHDGARAEDAWEPVNAPDGEELDERGGSSDGSESGQDAGSMS